MRALQEQICHYKTSSDEVILDVLGKKQDDYILLLYNENERQWTLLEWTDGKEQSRFHLKNLLSAEVRNSSGAKISLFSISSDSFGILAADEFFIWKSFRAKPRRLKLRMRSAEDLFFFQSNPVVFVRAMDDGDLILAHRTVFSEAYFYTIAKAGGGGYVFSRIVLSLDPCNFRHLFYMASIPCLLDILPRQDSIYLHSPGSFRNWQEYPAEGSVLVKMNRKGKIIHSQELERGRGTLSSLGNCIMIKPFDSDSLLYFYSLNEELSFHLLLDDHSLWTPGTPETRFCVSHKRVVAWDRHNFILSAFYNMPDWCSDSPIKSMAAC